MVGGNDGVVVLTALAPNGSFLGLVVWAGSRTWAMPSSTPTRQPRAFFIYV
jgi:hypothetical protein